MCGGASVFMCMIYSCRITSDDASCTRFVERIFALSLSLSLPPSLSLSIYSYKRRPDQAESILLSAQPPLLWRAIELNLILHRYDRYAWHWTVWLLLLLYFLCLCL